MSDPVWTQKQRALEKEAKLIHLNRRCHDCGRLTSDYRCADCLRRWREKNRVTSTYGLED